MHKRLLHLLSHDQQTEKEKEHWTELLPKNSVKQETSQYQCLARCTRGIAPPKALHAEYRKVSVHRLYFTYVFIDVPE